MDVMNAAANGSPYTSFSQQGSPGMPYTPETMRKWQYMDNIIKGALIDSPEGSACSPEAPVPIEREITYYEEIASNHKAVSQINAKYHMTPQDYKELDVVKSAFACMDEPIDMNSKEAVMLRKRDHDPTDIMNIMDVTMKVSIKSKNTNIHKNFSKKCKK